MQTGDDLCSTQLSADQRIWNLGYDQGYREGRIDGQLEGAEGFQAWLLEELVFLVQDVRLGLRHDTETPLEALAMVRQLVAEGKPPTEGDV
jgi:hypothetical protein